MLTHVSGIAAQAARGRPLGRKRRVEYRSLPSKSLLNRCANPRMPFRWTINPYRGCEIGCHYCYAAYTHAYLGLEDARLFDSVIFAKEEAGEILARELRRGVSGPIAIGTSTDPYQPAETRFGTTRGILEVFASSSGHQIGITTKSDLILRDLDLLGAIASRNELHVNVTVTTMDRELARLLEPRAVRPDKRIEAVRQLRWRCVSAGVFCAPVLPGITDSDEILGAVARAAKRADASYWGGHALFLRPEARERFMPVLEAEFPHLASRYRARFGQSAYVSSAYRAWLAAKLDRIGRQHRLSGRFPGRCEERGLAAEPARPTQRSLFDRL